MTNIETVVDENGNSRCKWMEAYINGSLITFGNAFDMTGKGKWVFTFNTATEINSHQPKAVIKAARSLLRKQVKG